MLGLDFLSPHFLATSSGSVSLNSPLVPSQAMMLALVESDKSSKRNCHNCIWPLPWDTKPREVWHNMAYGSETGNIIIRYWIKEGGDMLGGLYERNQRALETFDLEILKDQRKKMCPDIIALRCLKNKESTQQQLYNWKVYRNILLNSLYVWYLCVGAASTVYYFLCIFSYDLLTMYY